MTINTHKNPERVAECSRLIAELEPFEEELTEWEKQFTSQLEFNILRWGEATHVTDNIYYKLVEIYERIV